MSFLFCCCWHCLSTRDESAQRSEERQSLLQAESARLSRAKVPDAAKQKGKIQVKLVGIVELDQHFADIADTFNQQQEHYETMIDTWRALRDSYGCSYRNGLSECLQTIRGEHSGSQPVLQMRGYDLTLAASGTPPARLQEAQERVGVLGQAAKAVVAAGPRLQSMLGWVLQQEDLAQRVREASPSHQEQLRLQNNLQQNLQALRRAGELSARYRHEAGALLTEAATLAASA